MRDWTKEMPQEEIANVEYIISKIKREPKPTVNEFLDVISEAIDRDILPLKEWGR